MYELSQHRLALQIFPETSAKSYVERIASWWLSAGTCDSSLSSKLQRSSSCCSVRFPGMWGQRIAPTVYQSADGSRGWTLEPATL